MGDSKSWSIPFLKPAIRYPIATWVIVWFVLGVVLLILGVQGGWLIAISLAGGLVLRIFFWPKYRQWLSLSVNDPVDGSLLSVWDQKVEVDRYGNPPIEWIESLGSLEATELPETITVNSRSFLLSSDGLKHRWQPRTWGDIVNGQNTYQTFDERTTAISYAHAKNGDGSRMKRQGETHYLKTNNLCEAAIEAALAEKTAKYYWHDGYSRPDIDRYRAGHTEDAGEERNSSALSNKANGLLPYAVEGSRVLVQLAHGRGYERAAILIEEDDHGNLADVEQFMRCFLVRMQDKRGWLDRASRWVNENLFGLQYEDVPVYWALSQRVWTLAEAGVGVMHGRVSFTKDSLWRVTVLVRLLNWMISSLQEEFIHGERGCSCLPWCGRWNICADVNRHFRGGTVPASNQAYRQQSPFALYAGLSAARATIVRWALVIHQSNGSVESSRVRQIFAEPMHGAKVGAEGDRFPLLAVFHYLLAHRGKNSKSFVAALHSYAEEPDRFMAGVTAMCGCINDSLPFVNEAQRFEGWIEALMASVDHKSYKFNATVIEDQWIEVTPGKCYMGALTNSPIKMELGNHIKNMRGIVNEYNKREDRDMTDDEILSKVSAAQRKMRMEKFDEMTAKLRRIQKHWIPIVGTTVPWLHHEPSQTTFLYAIQLGPTLNGFPLEIKNENRHGVMHAEVSESKLLLQIPGDINRVSIDKRWEISQLALQRHDEGMHMVGIRRVSDVVNVGDCPTPPENIVNTRTRTEHAMLSRFGILPNHQQNFTAQGHTKDHSIRFSAWTNPRHENNMERLNPGLEASGRNSYFFGAPAQYTENGTPQWVISLLDGWGMDWNGQSQEHTEPHKLVGEDQFSRSRCVGEGDCKPSEWMGEEVLAVQEFSGRRSNQSLRWRPLKAAATEWPGGRSLATCPCGKPHPVHSRAEGSQARSMKVQKQAVLLYAFLCLSGFAPASALPRGMPGHTHAVFRSFRETPGSLVILTIFVIVLFVKTIWGQLRVYHPKLGIRQVKTYFVVDVGGRIMLLILTALALILEYDNMWKSEWASRMSLGMGILLVIQRCDLAVVLLIRIRCVWRNLSCLNLCATAGLLRYGKNREKVVGQSYPPWMHLRLPYPWKPGTYNTEYWHGWIDKSLTQWGPIHIIDKEAQEWRLKFAMYTLERLLTRSSQLVEHSIVETIVEVFSPKAISKASVHNLRDEEPGLLEGIKSGSLWPRVRRSVENHGGRELDDDYLDAVAVVSAKLLKKDRWWQVDWPADYADASSHKGQFDVWAYVRHIVPEDFATADDILIVE